MRLCGTSRPGGGSDKGNKGDHSRRVGVSGEVVGGGKNWDVEGRFTSSFGGSNECSRGRLSDVYSVRGTVALHLYFNVCRKLQCLGIRRFGFFSPSGEGGQ